MADDHQYDRRLEDVNLAAIRTRLKAIEDTVHLVMAPQLQATARELEANTRLVEDGNAANERIERNTEDIVAAVEAAKGLWEFLTRWGGRARRWSFAAAKWIGTIAGAVAAFTAAIKGVADVDLVEHFLLWWRK